MLRKFSVLALALVASLLVPVAAAPASANSAVSSVTGTRACERQFNDTVRRFDDAFLARDLPTFMSFYNKDATGISTAGTVRTTKAEIEASFVGLFGLEFTAVFTTINQVVKGCETGVVVSDFVLDVPAAGIHAHFVNNVTFIRERGRWQVLVDQNTPLPA